MKNIIEDYNYHYSDKKDHDGRPYVSDNKFVMKGRDTGHFGSGTYFSTFQFEDDKKYDIEDKQIATPEFIETKRGLYRVDLDFYNNLYRVKNETHGNVLFTTLENVNDLYYKVESGNFNCAKNYQIIYSNSQHLGLKCPTYAKLMRMAKDHSKAEFDIRSFSTVFMEYNGFNGVNVSGIRKFDNTTHGSVIYDLSKVNGDINHVTLDDIDAYKYSLDLSDHHNSVIYDKDNDLNMKVLAGNEAAMHSVIQNIPHIHIASAKRLLKNYADSGKVITNHELKQLSYDLRVWYYRYLYRKDDIRLNDQLIDNEQFVEDVMADHELLFWLNCYSSESLLKKIVQKYYNELDWSLSDDEIKETMSIFMQPLLSAIKRELTYNEKNFLKRLGL